MNYTQLANSLRMLAVDATALAKSGHAGMPCGMADIACVLWQDFLQHNPQNPNFYNRDRFVLSNGHGSMLLYGLLHLSGYDLTIDDLRSFRKLHSKTPGHPEFGQTPGVETSSGPLGQGLANAVGMAIAEQQLRTTYSRDNFNIIEHFTYAFVGDGCLMEGISHEAASLAGTLGLGKLIVFYDDNQVTIDGPTAGWFTEDIHGRFKAYGWQVIEHINGHDHVSIQQAILKARSCEHKPSLICCRTIIGYGLPDAGSCKTHGKPFNAAAIASMRRQLSWTYEPFIIPKDIYQQWDHQVKGKQLEDRWHKLFSHYQANYPDLALELSRRLAGELPDDWDTFSQQLLDSIKANPKDMATRKASCLTINTLADYLPELTGGSADLTSSNLTAWDNASVLSAHNPKGRYIHYGVREFAMQAIANGLALHGGMLPYVGTFLVFADYNKSAVRMAALMQQRVIMVYTHDSIGLGEDGPSHQPIEHLASLRLLPKLHTWRPCDQLETAIAWLHAISYQGPSALALSRQELPYQQRSSIQIQQVSKGGYLLLACTQPVLTVIATGSEVALAKEAILSLDLEINLVSMPCLELFYQQTKTYQQKVIPEQIPKLVVEAGSTDLWHKLLQANGKILGIDSFGASAPYADLYQWFKLDAKEIKQAIIALLEERNVKNSN